MGTDCKRAVEVLSNMKGQGLSPNSITYSMPTVIFSSDVVAFVRNQFRQHGDVQDRQSEDNVSIVITDLRWADWKNLPL
ncbi:hypothetical protein ACB098_05G185800 [Castanea mollissima]